MEKTDFDAVILDLGGVILNIDYNLTVEAFKALGFLNFEAQYSKMQQSGLFDLLETGMISEESFVSTIQESIPHASQQEIISAWNALLLDFPVGRIDTVQHIASQFPTYLLSNTNSIHYEAFNQTLKTQTDIADIKVLFKKTYLSHEIHLRKPNREAFQLIIDEHNLNPKRTLFVDDSPQHIEGAKKLDIQAYQMKDDDSLEALFASLLA
jgi:glucose-1-phosphatase